MKRNNFLVWLVIATFWGGPAISNEPLRTCHRGICLDDKFSEIDQYWKDFPENDVYEYQQEPGSGCLRYVQAGYRSKDRAKRLFSEPVAVDVGYIYETGEIVQINVTRRLTHTTASRGVDQLTDDIIAKFGHPLYVDNDGDRRVLPYIDNQTPNRAMTVTILYQCAFSKKYDECAGKVAGIIYQFEAWGRLEKIRNERHSCDLFGD